MLTFLAYMLFHATRKPPSIVKSVLKGDQPGGVVIAGGHRLMQEDEEDVVTNYGWAPFNEPGGQVRSARPPPGFVVRGLVGRSRSTDKPGRGLCGKSKASRGAAVRPTARAPPVLESRCVVLYTVDAACADSGRHPVCNVSCILHAPQNCEGGSSGMSGGGPRPSRRSMRWPGASAARIQMRRMPSPWFRCPLFRWCSCVGWGLCAEG